MQSTPCPLLGSPVAHRSIPLPVSEVVIKVDMPNAPWSPVPFAEVSKPLSAVTAEPLIYTTRGGARQALLVRTSDVPSNPLNKLVPLVVFLKRSTLPTLLTATRLLRARLLYSARYFVYIFSPPL